MPLILCEQKKVLRAAYPLLYKPLLHSPILRHLLPKATGMESKEFTSLLDLILSLP